MIAWSHRSEKTEMSVVDGGIIQVTRMDREAMEVESSSRQVQKQGNCRVHKMMLRFKVHVNHHGNCGTIVQSLQTSFPRMGSQSSGIMSEM